MTAPLTHKTSQNPQCCDLQMPCGSRCLIIFTCRCLISANQRWAWWKMRRLSVGCHSDAFTLGTGPFHRSPPWWISYISKARGKSRKTYSGKLSRFSHPTPSPQTPPGQAVGRKHGNCLRSRKELLACFLELSHDWDSFHIGTRALVSLREHDLNSVTYISFQAKKAA